MELRSPPQIDSTLEACLDDIDDVMALLDRYPPTLLAVALRIHLEALLQGLLDAGTCTRGQVRDFVSELLEGSLEADETSGCG